jgi:hypothetical protein
MKDYSTTIHVNATGKQAFNSINKVTKWWTENLEGKSQNPGDEFTVRFGDVHVSTQKLVEVIPDKRVVWLVTHSRLNFTRDMQEWTGTRIHFDIFDKEGETEVRFTHQGLVPDVECFDACSNAWEQYIQHSLKNLIDTGKGHPTPGDSVKEAVK